MRAPGSGELAEVGKVLRMMGQDELAEEFVETMSYTAEQAIADCVAK